MSGIDNVPVYEIPPEVLGHVASYADVIDLLSMAIVSSTFNVEAERVLYGRVDLSQRGFDALNGFCHAVVGSQRRAASVKELDIQATIWDHTPEPVSVPIASALKALKGLRTLRFREHNIYWGSYMRWCFSFTDVNINELPFSLVCFHDFRYSLAEEPRLLFNFIQQQSRITDFASRLDLTPPRHSQSQLPSATILPNARVMEVLDIRWVMLANPQNVERLSLERLPRSDLPSYAESLTFLRHLRLNSHRNPAFAFQYIANNFNAVLLSSVTVAFEQFNVFSELELIRAVELLSPFTRLTTLILECELAHSVHRSSDWTIEPDQFSAIPYLDRVSITFLKRDAASGVAISADRHSYRRQEGVWRDDAECQLDGSSWRTLD